MIIASLSTYQFHKDTYYYCSYSSLEQVTISWPSGDTSMACIPCGWGSMMVLRGRPVLASQITSIESVPLSAVIRMSSWAQYAVHVILLHYHNINILFILIIIIINILIYCLYCLLWLLLLLLLHVLVIASRCCFRNRRWLLYGH